MESQLNNEREEREQRERERVWTEMVPHDTCGQTMSTDTRLSVGAKKFLCIMLIPVVSAAMMLVSCNNQPASTPVSEASEEVSEDERTVSPLAEKLAGTYFGPIADHNSANGFNLSFEYDDFGNGLTVKVFLLRRLNNRTMSATEFADLSSEILSIYRHSSFKIDEAEISVISSQYSGTESVFPISLPARLDLKLARPGGSISIARIIGIEDARPFASNSNIFRCDLGNTSQIRGYAIRFVSTGPSTGELRVSFINNASRHTFVAETANPCPPNITRTGTNWTYACPAP